MPRKNKNAHKIGPVEEIENAKALDAAAGVAGVKRERELAEELDAKSIAALAPKLTYDTREKLLLKCAGEGLTNEFFEKFTDRKELLDLTCMLGIRKLAVIICCRDLEIADVKDVIATMRVVLNMVYGENASMSPEKFIPPPAVTTIPTGGTEGIDASVAKYKKLSGQ